MLGFSFCDRNQIDFNNLIKIELRTCDSKIMLQIVSTPKMEVDNNSEKVAILDAGAQYGKVRLEIKDFYGQQPTVKHVFGIYIIYSIHTGH